MYQDPDIEISVKLDKLYADLQRGDDDDLTQILIEYEFMQSSVLFEVLKSLADSQKVPEIFLYKIVSTLFGVTNDPSVIGPSFKNASLEFEMLRMFNDTEQSEKSNPTLVNRLYAYIDRDYISDTSKYSQLSALKVTSFAKEGVRHLFEISKDSRCTILCCQWLMESDSESNGILTKMREIATNPLESLNVRADACDTLLRYSKDSSEALSILRELGGNTSNIYHDTQNTHGVDISDGLKMLFSLDESKVDFNEIANELSKVSSKVATSLSRIAMDKSTYPVGGLKVNSEEIFVRLYSYISVYPDLETRETLKARLVEELSEMADTCSSGHAYRLVNVLSGFDGISTKISFRQQIISSFDGRLNAMLRESSSDSSSNTEEILCGMIDNDKNFLTFFAGVQSKIISELREEYKDFVSESAFDDTIREVLKKYEKFSESTEDIEWGFVKRVDNDE